MTIHWQISSGELQVWMYDTDPATDPPDGTISREFGVPTDYPREVLDLAFQEAKSAIDNNDFTRALRIQADAAFHQIQMV